MEKIGFVGLGNMGLPICKNLVRAGHQVKAYDSNPEALKKASKVRALPMETLEEVAKGSEVVFLSLPDQLVVRDVVLGKGKLLQAMSSGSVLVDLSTSLPSVTQEIGREAFAYSVQVLDAPVSGGPEGAEAGNLSIMVGGEKEVFERVFPLFKVIGDEKKIFHVGGLSTGHTMKLTHGLINYVTLVAISEAFVLGCKAGINPKTMFDIISVSRGNSGIFQSRAPRMLSGDFSAAFSLEGAYKDIDLTSKMAQDLKIPIYMTETARTMFQVARTMGKGNLDMAAVINVLEEWAGVNLRSS
jgi:2-hydroxymethylglutarate dehydrogenase